MNKIRKIIENSLYFLSSNLINFTLGFAASIILARVLKPEKLGIFHQVQWFAGTISTLLTFGFITCIVRYTAEYKAKNKHTRTVSMVRYVLYLELFITLISTAVLVLLSSPIADIFFSPKQSMFFLISFLGITPGILTAIFSSQLEGNQIFKYQGLHAITVTPLALTIKIILLVKGYGIEGLLWSNFAFSIVNLLYYFFFVKKEQLLKGWRTAPKFAGSEKEDFDKYNRSVFAIIIVDSIVWDRSENFFLGVYCPATEVAYYNLASNLLRKFTNTVPMLLWRILLPVASEHEGTQNHSSKQKTYYHSIRYSAFFMFPLISVCFVCAYELFVILYGQEYGPAKPVFQILCIGALITSITSPGASMIYAAKKQAFILWYGCVLAVFNICLNFLLIPKYGAIGASLCYVFITTFGALGGFYYLHRNLKLKLPWFSLLKIMAACLFMVLFVFLIIRQDASKFDLLTPLKIWLRQVTGWDFPRMLSPRMVRLAFSLLAGMCSYFLICLPLFSMDEDDVKIIKAMERFVPKSVTELILKWKQK